MRRAKWFGFCSLFVVQFSDDEIPSLPPYSSQDNREKVSDATCFSNCMSKLQCEWVYMFLGDSRSLYFFDRLSFKADFMAKGPQCNFTTVDVSVRHPFVASDINSSVMSVVDEYKAMFL